MRNVSKKGHSIHESEVHVSLHSDDLILKNLQVKLGT